MIADSLSRVGSIRPELEELSDDHLGRLYEEARAEMVRRDLRALERDQAVAEEQIMPLETWLWAERNRLPYQLERCERFATMWTERLDAIEGIRRGTRERPVEPPKEKARPKPSPLTDQEYEALLPG